MKDFLMLEMPGFKPEYKENESYGYGNAAEKSNLKAVLEASTGGFCMYCFSRVQVDGKLMAHLEHAIEKNNSDNLVECVPDIGLSCNICNQKFKRIGERKRRLPQDAIEQYERDSECSAGRRRQCKEPCEALRSLQECYSSLPEAEIILQPMGVTGSDSGEELRLQYNVMNMAFEPAEDRYTYSEKERRFIKAHISRFGLNAPEYRARQLFDFIKIVIDSRGILPEYEYNSLIVELFRKKLSDKPKEEILKICENIYKIIFLKVQQ